MKIGTVALALIAAGGGVTSAALLHTRSQLRTQLERAAETEANLRHTLRQAEAAHGETTARLNSVHAEQGETRARLTATELAATELRRDLAGTRSQLDHAEKQLDQRAQEASELRQSLALIKLEVAQAGADEIAAYQATIAQLEEQISTLTAPPPSPEAPSSEAPLLPSSPLPVLSVGPDNAFVVLGFGAADGARLDQTLEIRRGTESLATVLITSVHPHHAIAQVRPDTLRAGLHKGDVAIITLSP